MKSTEREEIQRLLQGINNAWKDGHPENLDEYFHENMVIAQPGGETMGKGKQVCIDSYRDFQSRARIIEFKESEPNIEVWENSAVASYTFEMTYSMDGKDHQDTGVDLYFFTREGGKWLAVWRAVLPPPQTRL